MMCNSDSLLIRCSILLQGFYYDAFYGDLGLNPDHFKSIESEADKAAKVVLLVSCFD